MGISRHFAAASLVVAVLFFPCQTSACNTDVYTDGEVQPALLRLINAAQSSIDIEMYTFTDQEVIQALQEAEGRGVEVRVILDPSQPANLKNVDQLKNRGIEVKWYPLAKRSLMHRKLAIFDGKSIFAGSTNWTYSGFHKNHEVSFLIEGLDVIGKLSESFKEDWYRSWLNHYESYPGGASDGN